MSSIRPLGSVYALCRNSLVLAAAGWLAACGGGGGGGGGVKTPPPATYTIGGTVSGLSSSGLVLQDNGGDNLTVAANATSFTFATPLATGAAYAVTVSTQPSNPAQVCTVASASGSVASANVTSVAITCTTTGTPTFTVGGTITGLTGSGLVLKNNGGDDLTVAANATTFQFATAIATGGAYDVTVATQPSNPAEVCTVAHPSGTVASAKVTSVAITCSTSSFKVGGTVTGLVGSGLVLKDNGGDNLTVTALATTFQFVTPVAAGGAYAVTVSTQPTNPAQICTVTNGSGTVGSGNVTTVTVACAAPLYKVGGTVSGLTSSGLVLQDNAGDNLTVPANATTFTFATGLKTGSAYAVTVLTQPSAPAELCTVTNGTGTVASAAITSVTVSCARVGQFVFVVNSIDGPTNNGDVSAFSINPTTGVLTAVPNSPFALGTNDSDPAGIAVDQNGHAYVTNVGTSNITYFDIATNGALTFQADPSSQGTVGAAIAVNVPNAGAPTACLAPSACLYVAGSSISSSTSGSVSGFTILSSSGALTTTPNEPYSAGSPLGGIAIDPTGQFVFTTQTAHDFITAYAVGSDGSLTGANGDPISTNQPGNPQGVVTSPLGTSTGGFLFVTNPAGNTVSVFSYVSANAPPTDPNAFLTLYQSFPTGGTSPEGIAIDPTGKYLYVANFQDNNVSSFSIDPQSGALTSIGQPVAAGNGPISLQVDPSGRFVYVVNQTDNSLSVFTAAAGALTMSATYPCGLGATAVAVE
jgi:6-phosphogluconolactonase (cycloisomerase 2 family)